MFKNPWRALVKKAKNLIRGRPETKSLESTARVARVAGKMGRGFKPPKIKGTDSRQLRDWRILLGKVKATPGEIRAVLERIGRAPEVRSWPPHPTRERGTRRSRVAARKKSDPYVLTPEGWRLRGET